MDAEQIVATPTPEALLVGVEPAGWMYTNPKHPAYDQVALKKVRPFNEDAFTETPLYTRAQVLAMMGQAVEACAQVADSLGGGRIERDPDGSPRKYDLNCKIGRGDATLNAMRVRAQTIAKAIRAYLPTPPSQDTQP